MTYNCKSTVSEILEAVVDILETAKINLENGQMTDDAYDDIRIAVSSLEIFEDDLDEEPEDFEETVEDEIMREFDGAFGMPLAQIDDMIMDTFFKR